MQDFFPLTVDYREKMASRGRIPGNFFRRETRASELETLTSRLIDRSLRPLFPSQFQKETVVTVTVYSADEQSDLITLGLLAASAALMVSDIPFNGPMVGGTVVSTASRTVFSARRLLEETHEFELVASFTPRGLVMLEGGSLQGTENQLIETLEQAASQMRDPFEHLTDWQNQIGKTKLDTDDVDQPTESQTVHVDVYAEALDELLLMTDKKLGSEAYVRSWHQFLTPKMMHEQPLQRHLKQEHELRLLEAVVQMAEHMKRCVPSNVNQACYKTIMDLRCSREVRHKHS